MTEKRPCLGRYFVTLSDLSKKVDSRPIAGPCREAFADHFDVVLVGKLALNRIYGTTANGRKPTTEKVKIVFSKWSLIGQQRPVGPDPLGVTHINTPLH